MCKTKKGFTLIEITIVLIIISLILISMFKVFRYVTDKKVPYYVYNLYNELQFINKSVDVDIDKLGKSLESLEPEEHCSLLYNRLNNIGSSNCSNVKTKQLNSSSDNIVYKYDCTRTINLSVNENGGMSSDKDPDIKKAKDDGTEWSSCSSYDSLYLQGRRQCTFNVQNVDPGLKSPFTNKEDNAAYSCAYKGKTGGDATIYDTVKLEDEKTLLSLNESFRSSNNIGFAFLTTYIDPPKFEKDEYKFKANITRCEICPDNDAISSSTKTVGINNYNMGNYFYLSAKVQGSSGQTYAGHLKSKNNKNDDLGTVLNSLYSQYAYGARGICGKTVSTSTLNGQFPTLGNKDCGSWMAKYEQYESNIANMLKHKEEKCWIWHNQNNTTGITCSQRQYARSTCIQNATRLESLIKEYDKWSKYFKNNGISTRANEAKYKKTGFLEGTYTSDPAREISNSNKRYLNHFIYVAIDKDFDKATINQNLFVFEQYGDKIIPVGYLANDKNSPLKFNVYTRDSQHHHVSKVAGNLTYCEAMSYVGGKVSEYCGCKDVNGNIVTEFEESTECGTLGCDLRAVRPNFKSVWLPRK